MIVKKDINWYLSDPLRLLKKKPFTRGGTYIEGKKVGNVNITSRTEVGFSKLKMNEISQDVYLQEYDPSLHKIRYNRSIPHIAVKVGNSTIDIDDMTIQAAYEKNIHANHVQHLANKPMEFTLCNSVKKDKGVIGKVANWLTGSDKRDLELFQEFKERLKLANMESVKYDAISKQQKVSDVGLLFTYDKEKNKITTRIYSYDDGYIVIPNYNEFGEKIACSLYYTTEEGDKIIDTYDSKYHYRFTNSVDDDKEVSDNGWVMTKEEHGFSRCPLLYKRGKVAWEYGISAIEMWELMANINSIALKRFGTFGLVLKGEMDENSFKRDSSTLIINLAADSSGEKQDAKVLEFPEPQKMLEYLDYLEEKISTFTSVSFINPKDIKNTGSGGNGIFLSMKNDLALATQSINDWSEFVNEMTYMYQEGFSLEDGDLTKFTGLKIVATLKAWSMESDTTKITNLAMQAKWLSRQTIIEKSPDAAPDELHRIEREEKIREQEANDEALKAEKIAKNNSVEIQDDINKTTYSNTNN